MPMINANTFVCYAREDSDFVSVLRAGLTARGVRTWQDIDIPPGTDWDRGIDESLRTCANVLIVLSPSAVSSDEVKGELRTALNLRKPIVPLLYRPCVIPRQLLHIQYVDCGSTTDTNTVCDELTKALQPGHHDGVAVPDPSGPRQGSALNNRRDVLDDVKSESVGRLEQSLHAGTVNVLKEKQPEQVTRRWDAEVKVPFQPRIPVTPNVSAIQVFDEATVAGRLLILGAPGSGKTTMLLELCQELVARAEANVDEPMPILCNLSSWRDDGRAFVSWLLDQLKRKYGIRRDVGNKWLSERSLVPLLDGLDEVTPEEQERCVHAINAFQEDFLPKHVVVCCRAAAYENYRIKLQLNGAIHLLPLTDDQIQRYLVNAGYSDLWQRVSADPHLAELARSPLLLGVLTVAYKESSTPERRRLTSGPQAEAHLFDSYISRLLSNSPNLITPSYSKKQTTKWLGWLARTMKEQGQAEFLIEHLQPTWLPSVLHRCLYRSGVLLTGAGTLVLAIFVSEWVRDAIPNGAMAIEFTRIATSGNTFWSQDGVLIALIGVAAGVILAMRRNIQPIETLAWSKAQAWNGISSGVHRFVLLGLNYLTYAGVEIGLLLGLTSGFPRDRLSPALAPWVTAAQIMSAVAVVSLAVAVGLIWRPSMWLVGGSKTRSYRWSAHAFLCGIAFGLGAWARMGFLFGVSSGLGIGLIVGFSGGSTVLSATRFAKALVIGLTCGLGSGSLIWWIVRFQAPSAVWVGNWMLGGVGVAATSALFIGVAARFKNQGEALENPVARLAVPEQRWTKWLVVGGIISALSGLILGGVGRSGGFPLVQSIANMISWLGIGWVSALTFSLFLAISSAVLAITMGTFLGALFGVLKGLTGPDVERRTVPNQGIRQSAVNVGRFALLGGMIVGIPYGVVNVIIAAVITRVPPSAWDWLNVGLGSAVLFALLGGLVPGAACLQHFTLRLVLSSFGFAPWRYARFLNYATERTLLHRVGGRYRFIHPLLRDHLAAMDLSASARGRHTG